MITAVLSGSTQAETARTYGVSQGWISRLMKAYRAEGEAVFEPRSRSPQTRPNATPQHVVDLILSLRAQLTADGLDAGADTIAWHLIRHHAGDLAGAAVPSRATIHRILARHAVVVPEPAKRPKSSYIRFAAEAPNETWQADFTHVRLATPTGLGTDVEVLTWIDDHSRYALSITAHARVTGPIVLGTFRAAVAVHGCPASTLTDNGLVFTTRFSGGHARGKTSRNGFETELRRLGVRQKNSRPNHPTTCGKVERFQQTMKKWLRALPAARQPATLGQLQTLLEEFRHLYNHQRPHRSLPHRATPATVYDSPAARPKALPGDRTDDDHARVRTDRVSDNGSVSLRYHGRLHHIGIGRTHARTHVTVLVDDLHITVIDAATGEILRDLILDPSRDYQPTGRPRGPQRKQ